MDRTSPLFKPFVSSLTVYSAYRLYLDSSYSNPAATTILILRVFRRTLVTGELDRYFNRPTSDDHLALITSMVSSNRRRLSRASAVSTAPLSFSQEAPSTDAVDEIVANSQDASTTGDSDSVNPLSLPEPSVATTDVAAHLSFASNPSSNLAPGVGGGNPLQNFCSHLPPHLELFQRI